MSDRRGADGGSAEGRLYAVDRIESPERGEEAIVVLIADDGTELRVRRAEFGEGAEVEEGAVYRVNPRALDWRTARRERGEEARRRSAGADAMAKLRRKDPGGDLEL